MPKPKLSIIVAVCDRYEHLALMVRALENAAWLPAIQLVVVDHKSRDGDIGRLLRRAPFKCRLVERARPFRRAAGLNAGFRVARAPLVFFTDADMIHPPDLVPIVSETVKPGVCYFPICHNLLENADPATVIAGHIVPGTVSPRPRKKGWGICGFHHRDFKRIMWNERFKRWGKEDNDLKGRAVRKHGLKLIRRVLPGLYHMWHAASLEFRNKNY